MRIIQMELCKIEKTMVNIVQGSYSRSLGIYNSKISLEELQKLYSIAEVYFAWLLIDDSGLSNEAINLLGEHQKNFAILLNEVSNAQK